MKHLVLPGCWYSDSLPDGKYVSSVFNQPITKTNNGDRTGHKLLWTTINIDGDAFCGVGHQDDIAWEHTNQWNSHGIARGSYPIIYWGREPIVIHDTVGAPTGSQGNRYIADSGEVIHGDDTMAPESKLGIQYGITKLWQFTVRDAGNFVVGELQDGVGARINNKYIRINNKIPGVPEQQQARNVRFKWDGINCSISWYYFTSPTEYFACFLWCTSDELRQWANEVTEPIPIPQPTGEKMIKSFDRPFWMAPYFSHHVRYGDVPIEQHMGNAIAVLGDERDASIRDKELERLLPLGKPLIVDIDKNQPPENSWNQTVAWLAAGGDISQLAFNVSRALTYNEKPVIAYLDLNPRNSSSWWPANNPFSSNRVWPSISAYRFSFESLQDFENRVRFEIEKCKLYNLPMVLAPRFDNFNNSQPVSKILECMELYEEWMREFFFVGFMPFADLRRNQEQSVFGMRDFPELLAWAKAFFYAIPSERPNRFDYWKPENSSIKDVLKNKWRQQRAAVVLEDYLRKDILYKYENDFPSPPPNNPPTPPIPQPPDPDGTNWSMDQWRDFLFNLIKAMNVGPLVTFEALKEMRVEINKHGGDWQNGWRGDYRPRLHMPVKGFPIPMTKEEINRVNPLTGAREGTVPEQTWSKFADLGDWNTEWKWVPR